MDNHTLAAWLHDLATDIARNRLNKDDRSISIGETTESKRPLIYFNHCFRPSYDIKVIEKKLDAIQAVLDRAQSLRLPDNNETKEHRLLKIMDYGSKGISIISGIAVIVFIGLIVSGQLTIGNVHIRTLLTILGFTLVGGLISIGGVKMFSINANLRKAKGTIERLSKTIIGCPFVAIVHNQHPDRVETYRPGNPRFCVRCPLGRDITGGPSIDGSLLHVCKVYPALHREWRELPGALEELHRG